MVSRPWLKSARVGVAATASCRLPWPQDPMQLLENTRKPRHVIPRRSGQTTGEIGSDIPQNIGDISTNPLGTKFAEIFRLPAWQSAKEIV